MPPRAGPRAQELRFRSALAVGQAAARLLVMKRWVQIPPPPVVLAAIFISCGPAVIDRAAAADQGKGAECAPLDDPAARLACFDAAFPWPPRINPPKSAAAAAAIDASTPAA